MFNNFDLPKILAYEINREFYVSAASVQVTSIFIHV